MKPQKDPQTTGLGVSDLGNTVMSQEGGALTPHGQAVWMSLCLLSGCSLLSFIINYGNKHSVLLSSVSPSRELFNLVGFLGTPRFANFK